VRVRARHIEVQLIGVHLGEEIAAASEVFQIEKFIFFEAMHDLHIALVGMRGRWDAHVLTVAEGGGKWAFEFAAVVGLPDQIPQRDSVAIQMLLNTSRENSAGRRAAFFGEGPEQQAAVNFAGGVLNGR
jgi:hypothetical protein